MIESVGLFSYQNPLMNTPSSPSSPDPEPQVNPNEPKPSYVKLAMRNMVRKGGKSLFHLALTTVSLVGFLVGIAYLTR
jgi:hypothetical protein